MLPQANPSDKGQNPTADVGSLPFNPIYVALVFIAFGVAITLLGLRYGPPISFGLRDFFNSAVAIVLG